MGKILQKICLTYNQFIDSTRFLTISLLNLVSNLSEEIHRIICKFGHNDEKCETYVKCDCFLEYSNFKDNLTEYKSLCCNKNYHLTKC